MKTIVFDMDGVIFDTENCYMICWKEVARKHQLKDIETVVRACMGTNIEKTRQIVEQYLGKDIDAEEFLNETFILFNEKYGENIPIKEGVFELLSYLKENNYKIGLASSTNRKVVVRELTNAHLISYFDVIVGGDMVQASKPEPDIYLKACQQLNEKPENCYAIEDSYNGIRSAYNGHLHAIMVPDLVEPNEEMKEKAEYICPNLLSVIDILKG